MKASKIKPVEPHRLLKPDEVPRRADPIPRVSPLFIRKHSGVTFPEDRREPQTAMDAAFQKCGW